MSGDSTDGRGGLRTAERDDRAVGAMTGQDRAPDSRVSGWAVVGVILAAVIFAAASTLFSAFATPTYSVSARVIVRPDPTIGDPTPPLPSTDQNNIYMQSQVLAVEGYSDRIPAGIDLSVSQVGLTNLIEITASGGTTMGAVKAANTVLDAYVAQRHAGLESYSKSAIAAVERQLASVTSQLKTATGRAPGAAARRGALSSEYNRLVSLQNQLTLSANTAQPTTVVTRAAPADVSQATNKARNAFLAGVVGALIAIAIWVSTRRMSWSTSGGGWLARRRAVKSHGRAERHGTSRPATDN